MGLFLIALGMLLWVITTVTLYALASIAAMESEFRWAVGIFLVAVVSTAGIVATVGEAGWVRESLPADGCYRIDRGPVPLVASDGKAVTVTEVDDVGFTSIPCPADESGR